MRKLILAFGAFIFFSSTGLSQDTLEYNDKSFYEVSINDKPQYLYPARVSAMPVNVWPGVTRPLQQTEIADFCSFDFNSPTAVVIESKIPVQSVTIRPQSLHIKPIISGNKISFSIDKPGQIVVEVNGWHHAISIFANTGFEVSTSHKNDIYFGPGIHHPGVIVAESNQNIYLADGALVYGAIYGKNINNLVIHGHGILDGSFLKRNVDTLSLIDIEQCRNVTVEGIVLRNAQVWTFKTFECDSLQIQNIKIIGMWRYNTDGIDMVNSRNILVQNSFVRAFDDCIVIKGLRSVNVSSQQPGANEPASWNISNILVRNCVVWNDWGRALEIGAETVADSIRSIVFENNDVIHFVHIALDIQNGNRAHVSDIVYDDIRVEDPITENAYLDDLENQVTDLEELKQNPRKTYKFTNDELGRLFVIEIKDNGWVKDTGLGSVDNVLYKDISYTSSYIPKSFFEGFSEDHAVTRITFDNVNINGVTIKNTGQGNFYPNQFVHELSFKQ